MPYANPEDQKAHSRQYYLANKERRNAYSKQWAKNNKDKVNEAARLWGRNNPDKMHAKRSKRRVSLGSDTFPSVEWKSRLEKFDGYCPYCATDGHSLTIDHVIPVSLGGTNALWNLVPCCLSCNSSKADKMLEQWKPEFNFLHLMEYF